MQCKFEFRAHSQLVPCRAQSVDAAHEKFWKSAKTPSRYFEEWCLHHIFTVPDGLDEQAAAVSSLSVFFLGALNLCCFIESRVQSIHSKMRRDWTTS